MKIFSKKFINIFILFTIYLILPNFICAQNQPNWVDFESRKNNYPNNIYLTGFAQDNLNVKDSLGKEFERIENKARQNLSSSIIIDIKSYIKYFIESININEREEIRKNFESNVTTITESDINGVDVDSYLDKSNIIYGFAFAKRNKVIDFYYNKLYSLLNEISSRNKESRQYELKGEKAKARIQDSETLLLFQELEKDRLILIALDKDADTSKLQLSKAYSLRNEIKQAIIRLQNGISIYIESNEDLFGEKTNLLSDKIIRGLSENKCNCNYTTVKTQPSDWQVRITAKAREFNKTEYGNHYCYVDITILLTQTINNKNIYKNQFSIKGGHPLNYKEAARVAFNDVNTNEIANTLYNYINK